MARLPYLNKENLAPEHQALLERDINLFKALAHSPGGLKAFTKLGGYLRAASPLDARLRELAILQVGWMTRSPYEWSHHIKIGCDVGVSDDDIRALIDESMGRESRLDPIAKLVCRAAREMTLDLKVSEDTFTDLRKEMTAEALNDIVLTIAYYNAVVRILASLEIDVEDEYLTYLEQFPLPQK
jgi:alkylhydroperoxidase family enzyme